MNKEEIYSEWEKVVKIGKKETEEWILSLTDEEFKLLCQFPIITQAKIHYNNIRKK